MHNKNSVTGKMLSVVPAQGLKSTRTVWTYGTSICPETNTSGLSYSSTSHTWVVLKDETFQIVVIDWFIILGYNTQGEVVFPLLSLWQLHTPVCVPLRARTSADS